MSLASRLCSPLAQALCNRVRSCQLTSVALPPPFSSFRCLSAEDNDSEPGASFKKKGKDYFAPGIVISPQKHGNWTLMESMKGKVSLSIPVFSTVAKGDEASPNTSKPLSMWPGMYHSPVTAALWAARTNVLDRAWNAPMDGPAQRKVLTRTPSHSRTSIVYAFSGDKILQEQYRNPWGGIRIGKLLEDLDALAGTVAVKHAADDDPTTRPLMIVTASVDKIYLFKPLILTEDLIISGTVAWVGRSSMEIRMEVIQPVADDSPREQTQALVANFTFVALDSVSWKTALVNRLQPESEEEQKLLGEGEARDAKRKERKKNMAAGQDNDRVVQSDSRLQALLSAGRVLKEMPTLADRNHVLISDTRLENGIICQPQQRNMHGRIFGGFLMRRAYELAYATCYVFCGTKPVFLEVDLVDFRRPVDVGDFLRFKACVLYTEVTKGDVQLMHIEVVAHATQPEQRTSEISNTFYFTFTVDKDLLKDGALPVFKVVPSTEEEARTVLTRYDADHLTTYPLLEKQESLKLL